MCLKLFLVWLPIKDNFSPRRTKQQVPNVSFLRRFNCNSFVEKLLFLPCWQRTKQLVPNVSFLRRFHCSSFVEKSLLLFLFEMCWQLLHKGQNSWSQTCPFFRGSTVAAVLWKNNCFSSFLKYADNFSTKDKTAGPKRVLSSEVPLYQFCGKIIAFLPLWQNIKICWLVVF